MDFSQHLEQKNCILSFHLLIDSFFVSLMASVFFPLVGLQLELAE